MRFLRAMLFMLGCCAVLTTGCGQGDASFAEVRGEVTYCGLPAAAEVLFEPLSESVQAKGRPSTDTTDARGKFQLRLSDSTSGAKIGRHRVTIRVHRLPELADRTANAEPGTVGPLKISQLLRDVRPDSNNFHFALTP